MSQQALLWTVFSVFIAAMLMLDLVVFHRKAHVIKLKEALLWCSMWISLALLFAWGMYEFRGKEAALLFLTGYLIEYALSVDNIFVFVLIFSYFHVPARHQHKVLFWGILGAILMRALFIVVGVALIDRFHFMIYILGVFLIFTGIKLAMQRERGIHLERNPLLRLFKYLFPVTDDYENSRFFVKKGGRLAATPLFIVLLVVETTDVVFAADSIPAILAITTDITIVYTSNVFAILGLRALYFALAAIIEKFYYLRFGLMVILVFVGMKMLISDLYAVPVGMALGMVFGTLIISVAASVVRQIRGTLSVNEQGESDRMDDQSS